MKKDTILDEFEIVMEWVKGGIERRDEHLQRLHIAHLFGFFSAIEHYDPGLKKRLSRKADKLMKEWNKN
jgi:hypothetical protein